MEEGADVRKPGYVVLISAGISLAIIAMVNGLALT
jgi:hypothetical protein